MFLEDENFRIDDGEIVLSEGSYEYTLVVCSDFGDTVTMPERREELDEADRQVEETETVD